MVVDKTGRRPLLIWGGAIMVATIACVGVLIAYFFHHNHGKLPEGAANGTLALICIFLAAYETSWGKQLKPWSSLTVSYKSDAPME